MMAILLIFNFVTLTNVLALFLIQTKVCNSTGILKFSGFGRKSFFHDLTLYTWYPLQICAMFISATAEEKSEQQYHLICDTT